MTDVPTEPDDLSANLAHLGRSSDLFVILLLAAVAVVFVSSIYSNYRVVVVENQQHRQGIELAAEQHRLAVDEAATHRQTAAARKASCNQFNVQQRQAITGSDVHDVIEANAISPPPRSADEAARVERALGAEHNAALTQHPLRDCTEAGIAKYLGLTKGRK